MMVNNWIVIGKKYFIQLKTNIVRLFFISVFIGCGPFESNDNDGIADKVYVALQGLDQVVIVDLEMGGTEAIDISYEFADCSGLDLEECLETSGCMWMASMGHCHGAETHEPHFIAIDEINRFWFVTTIMTGWVGSYNLDTNELIDTIKVGDFPALMVVNLEDQKLFVSRMMSMEDHTQSSTFIQEINYNDNGMMTLSENYEIGSPAPHSIAINSNGSELYTATYEGDWLFKLLLNSNEPNEETPLEVGFSDSKSDNPKRIKPVQVVLVQDSLLFISCEGGEWTYGAGWDTIPGQLQLWNTNKMEIKDTLHLGKDSRPWHIINSPINNRVYVALKGQSDGNDNTDGIACISFDLSNEENILVLEWVKRSDMFALLHGIDISADGDKLYVSGRIDGKLHVLNAQDGEVLQSIYLGPEIETKPSGVTYYSGSN